MSLRSLLGSILLGAALNILVGCYSPSEQTPSAFREQKLTPELAKEALLEMMRSKPGKDLGWFNGNIPEKMSKMKIEKEKDEDGWYAWGGAFRFNPSKAIYSLVVRPKPGVWACVFEYKGSFVCNDWGWSATPPELASTAF